MREKNIKRVFLCCLTALAVNTYAQNFNWVSSTEGNTCLLYTSPSPRD